MQDVLNALRDIQDLDFDLFGLRRELRRLPAEKDKRQAELNDLESKLKEVEAELAAQRARIKEIEDDTTMQRQRMRKVESEASKARGDAALQAAYQHQSRSLKHEISDAEEEGLQMVEQGEVLDKRCRELREKLEAEREVFAELSANVEKEVGEATTKLEALEAERKARLTTEIAPDVMGTYERLLNAREGNALAELEGRICQGCFISVPPNIFVRLSRALELVQCPSCDRILYLRDD